MNRFPRRLFRSTRRTVATERAQGPRKVPKGDIYYGEIAKGYEAERVHTEHWQQEQAQMEQFLHDFPVRTSVLDVAVGTGRFFPLYAKREMQVTAIDSSADMIAESRRRASAVNLLARLDVGFADALPYDDDAFDLVVCFRFLPHIVSSSVAIAAISEISRVTRGHALLHLAVRNDGFPRDGKPEPEERLGSSLYRSELEQLLEERGLRFVRASAPIRRKPKRAEYIWLCASA